ncbi:5-hydroxyisourate hydrolase-like isoform X3 [Penaeus japonicus]|uniref:5-hydroxyisourate hydrolase-like isoform X3 n=1 Tax=Penaeus japonicus TaxID=27405 RepID=UPI001C714E04|nr:5-hydroxyisourate hydrolase-like isoform X3 [Penaeus japonicus]
MSSNAEASRLHIIQRHLSRQFSTGAPTPLATSMAGNPLTSHVLDTATGRPAANMKLSLHRLQNAVWQEIAVKETNSDGRAGQFLSQEAFTPGTYKMFFDTGDYFRQQGTTGFYPYVEIVFVIEKPEEHYHIPLLLSPYGYSTYRGS